ncbi:MAG: hypothetical protein AB1428_08445 [Bacteroidota bacterium]
MSSKTFRWPVGVLLAALASFQAPSAAQSLHVDYGYAPASHFTAICFPSDWQKTIVTERGTLGYDFGPGPYARPLTEVSVGIQETTVTIQRLAINDPRVPIVVAEFSSPGGTIRQEAFALPGPAAGRQRTTFANGAVRRIGGLNGVAGWANPPAGTDPAFRNVAWGTNRPILYRVRVPRGAARLVAMGICEPYKPITGQRVLELSAEGSAVRTVEALKDTQRNRPYVYFFDAHDANNDGELALEVHASQQGIDPNVTLNAFWIFPQGTRITEEEVIHGEGTRRAEFSWSCGLENELGAPSARVDGILAEFTGAGVTPVVNIKTSRTCVYETSAHALLTRGRPFVMTRPAPAHAMQTSGGWQLLLPHGTRDVQVYVINGASGNAFDPPDLHAARRHAEKYWKEQSVIPFGSISVPDPGIQYLLDASTRNLYQISEWVDDQFQFQPGPSVYRGLWIHDQAWHVSAALYLGDTAAARRSIETMMQFQRPDGKVVLSEPFPMQRETPLLIFAIVRYAEFAGDRRWLAEHWGKIVNGVSWIRSARNSTLSDPSSSFYGLFPPGFADGGLGGIEAEYGTTYWGVIGLHAAARAAGLLDERDSSRSWDALAGEIMASFRRAAARDTRIDAAGNRYLPMKVGDTASTLLPQQANWGILDAQGLGHLFPYDDPTVKGTLAMLDAASKEGLPHSVGWLKNGIWSFFGALLGISHAWQRNLERAQDILYAYANHASPLGTWVEEQLPRGEGTRTTGDASNATASSLYIKLLRRLLVIERRDTLEILAGMPAEWCRPGARLSLKNAGTQFGPLTLDLRVTPDGRKAEISIAPLARGGECVVRLDLDALRAAGFVPSDPVEVPLLRLRAGDPTATFAFDRRP